MRKIAFALLLTIFGFAAKAQNAAQKTAQPVAINDRLVDISCGECQFKMKGKSCDLAVRIDGKAYFVDGKSIDDFGDAHDKKHGFCNAVRQAKVTGEIVNNRFKAKKIDLIAPKSK